MCGVLGVLSTRTKSLNVANPSAGVKSSMISSHLFVLRWRPVSSMVMMSFSMVTRCPDKVTSSIKPVLADDWSLSSSGCTASPSRTSEGHLAVLLLWRRSRELAGMNMQNGQDDIFLVCFS